MARKKRPEEHENHERWLVSYADFITLLFAFFVVMYAISSINEGKYRVLSDSLVDAFKQTPTSQEPLRLAKEQPSRPQAARQMILQPIAVRKADQAQEIKRKKQEEKMKGIATDLLKVMEPLVKEGQVRVTQSPLGVSIEINASVLFAPGQAQLEKPSIQVLKAVAQVVAGVPNAVQIEGHTDNIPIGTPAYPSNWELSTARASSVVRLFIDNGVDPSRLMAIGYADQRPVEPNDTNEGRSRNRRVTVMIEPDDKAPATVLQ
ncbi:flagellar motor protein MotD [Sulfurimicrobium lacus]|uniref:Flagellar motor protein MotD n=1 Tax=Sulfurimicrobium lacus TaxID=2715678 RepID=A0A6F8VAL7_9PROT|nr:flagellar motor protein MotD [Sulfurimicrobium lacus]BCB26704.1 flagellar motor protein MotD [Sulfurimicrobium lacus]